LSLQRFFAGGGQIEADQVEQVFHAIQKKPELVEIKALQEEVELSQTKLTIALSQLEAMGIVKIQPNGEVAILSEPQDPMEVSLAATEAQERHQRLKKSRVEMMRNFAELHDCRREFLLNYFGEAYTPPCGNCDNCEAGRIQAEEAEHPFPLNSRVTHSQWGEGVVMRYEGDKLTVLFNEMGYKTLALDVVLENELLTTLNSIA
jgi:ATP-dependent DNA helicase RecQ